MKKQYSTKKVISVLLSYWKVAPWVISLAIFLEALNNILNSAVSPLFISKLFINISNGSATLDNSLGLLVGYGAIIIFSQVILFRIVMYFAYQSGIKLAGAADMQTISYITAKSVGYHSDKMSGGLVSDINKFVQSIDNFWDLIIFNINSTIVTIVSVCIALSFILWQFSLALFLFSVISISIIVYIQSRATYVRKVQAKAAADKTAYLADVISNIPAVKSFARETFESREYKKKITKWNHATTAEMKSVLKIGATFSTLITLMNISALFAAILAIQYHLANVGTIYLIITYTFNVTFQIWNIAGLTRSYIRTIGDAAPMVDTLDEEIEICDPVDPEKFIVNKGMIEFKNVDFTHSENDEALFKDFSLTIKSGEKIGIVGVSGSGKTSLTRLLLRFSDIDSGKILIDGQDITQVTQADLHEAISFVPQEPLLFHRSLRENIAYGKLGANDDEISEAARQANALEFIDVLKHGFDTLVGERGIKLSGGQRQRIAIARAILKDAPILVLDEATSALDSETEKLIQDALTKLMGGRTSIVIAHRLSTISKLDRIIVLDNGKIVEQGSHSELLKHGGTYYKLWSHQSGGFIEE